MRTFSIYTLGCKVNQYESRQIGQFLEGLGLCGVKPGQKPDLCVINTCCVTAAASAKSRQYVQRAVKLNPATVRVICGCLPAMNSREMTSSDGDNVHIVSSRDKLPAMLARIVIGETPSIKPKSGVEIKDDGESSANCPKLPPLTRFAGHTRAFLKVQDGCDGTCSYCIIPKVRPNVQSKPINEAVAEARALVAAGHKEIVVTGVNLGAYGRKTVRRSGNLEFRIKNEECERYLAELLDRLGGVPELKRIRVSSLEPGDINDKLLDVFCSHNNIMPHIHLSVQSGSDRILKRMCRQYDLAELREKIALIKSQLDRPAITADCIVGFPAETEEDFEQTVELAKWAGFSKIHVFAFSPREGTAAAKMKDRIQPKVVKHRAAILRNLGDDLGRKFREQFIEEICEVLIENTEPLSGRCERYFIVKVKSEKEKGKSDFGFGSPVSGQSSNSRGRRCASIVKVKITAVTEDGAEGEVKS